MWSRSHSPELSPLSSSTQTVPRMVEYWYTGDYDQTKAKSEGSSISSQTVRMELGKF